MVIRSVADVRAYQEARRLVVECYRLARGLPNDERFGIASQLSRAACSVKSNIAEGYGRRGSDLDLRRFLRDA